MKASIQSHMWGYEVHQGGQTVTLWRPMDGMDFGSNQGLLKMFVSWRNDSEEELIGQVGVSIIRSDGSQFLPHYLYGNNARALPGQSMVVMFELDLQMIPPELQGKWEMASTLYEPPNAIDQKTINFTVGHAQPLPPTPPTPPPVVTHTWVLPGAGSYPKHMPDNFEGEVILDNQSPPSPIQGVYMYSAQQEQWVFWAKGAPGCRLSKLLSGKDYLVTTTGACKWEIPLSVGYE